MELIVTAEVLARQASIAGTYIPFSMAPVKFSAEGRVSVMSQGIGVRGCCWDSLFR